MCVRYKSKTSVAECEAAGGQVWARRKKLNRRGHCVVLEKGICCLSKLQRRSIDYRLGFLTCCAQDKENWSGRSIGYMPEISQTREGLKGC